MSLKEKIVHFERKSIKVKLLTATFLSVATLLGLILLFSILEYTFWFDSIVRTVFFYLVVAALMVLFYVFILPPLLRIIGMAKRPDDEKLAKEISDKLPELNDDLINYLQLEKNAENELAKASIEQKAKGLLGFDFLKAIDFSNYKRFGQIFGSVGFVFLLIIIFNRPIFTSGTQRLVLHSKEFVRPAPFQFVIQNDSLSTYQGKNFEVVLKLEGENIPSAVHIMSMNGVYKMNASKNGRFTYVFQKPSESIQFYFEAAGYSSQSYEITLLNKPILNLMSIELTYPKHVGLENEIIANSGNIMAPSGTIAKWTINSNYSDKAFILLGNDSLPVHRIRDNQFVFSHKLVKSGQYDILLQNKHSFNESTLSYTLNIVEDEAPAIQVEFLPDTANYKYLVATGTISDDYGFRSLELILEVDNKRIRKPIIINSNVRRQNFYGEWLLDSLRIRSEQTVTIYAQVRDNDAPNGFKSAKSAVFHFKKPSFNELSQSIDRKAASAENQIDRSLQEMKELQKALEALAQKLKSQNKMGWQEEKMLEESLEQRKELEKMLNELKEKHDDLLKASNNFEQSQTMKEKSKELNKLIEDLMDDATKQLYEELQKLMQEKKTANEINDKLNQINRQENRMMKDLERTKELFKRLKMESGLERVSQQLDSLASKQEQLSEKDLDSMALTSQEKIEKEFNDLSKDLDELEKLNQELERPEPLDDFDADKKEINQEMQKAGDNMKAGDKAKSQQSQKKAAQQMREMSKKMQNMQAGMEMEVMQENIGQLRQIMDDLIRLSYKQEDIIGAFRTVNPSDPRFISLSQNQVKLKEDLVVIEDSLLSLASRVVQLSSFITKEVDEIDMHMKASVEQIKERQRGRALSHQQFAMTSMNNLALLLDDVLQQMQMTMAESSGKGKGKQQKLPMPGLGEMQQQLSEQIQKLQNEGKTGRELSEELARMAAEQEMIRQQLQELQNKLNGQMGGEKISDDLSKVMKMMEDNEVDLVNKRLTRQLMERQKEITTRLLESEKAIKEQQEDQEREGETAQQRERIFPPKFEEYLKERKKEIELLRSVPIDLKPFYKKEVNDYFRRLSEQN